MRIKVSIDVTGTSALTVHYDAALGDTALAEARVRYVCIDSVTSEPAPLPEALARLEEL